MARLTRLFDRYAALSVRAGGTVRQHPGDTWEQPLTLVGREPIADDVVRLTLAGSAALPTWSPGAHVDVLLPSGRQRSYSLCGDPALSVWQVAVRRLDDGGGGSVEMHGLQLGDVLRVRGPRQAFPLAVAPSYLFLAGGIGITPLLPMARAAAAAGADWRLVHAGRSRASLPKLLGALDPARATVSCDDEVGLLDLPALIGSTPPAAAVYVCGPPPMLAAASAAFRALPPSGRSFHAERFAPPPVVDGKPFEVRLARAGVTVEVGATETMLTALRVAVPGVAYSCRQGFCHTCVQKVLGGAVQHRGTPVADRQVLTCVSRGSDLVLDL